MKRLLIDNIKKTGSIFAIFGVVAGTISDILQPLFPFVSYIFFATTFSSILLLLTLVLLKSLQTKIIPSFLFSFSIMIFSGIFYIIQTTQTEDSGFLAEKIPVVSNLQSYIGIIQDDISTIKTTTENIDEKTDIIVDTLQEIQNQFLQINQTAGIIDNPNRPEQFYHNARIQEQSGDYINARKSYNSYFSFKLDFIDPHLRYQTFLKIQEGVSGAREIYASIYNNDPRPIIEFMYILLFDTSIKIEKLKAFILKNPNFSPAYYELSREYSKARKGNQSLIDKKEEYKALQKFKLTSDEGNLLKYFVDKEFVSQWIDDVDVRFKALSLISQTFSSSPVKINATNLNNNWQVEIQIAEPVKEIFYSIDSQLEYNSTGLTTIIDSETGTAKPSNQIFIKKRNIIPGFQIEENFEKINLSESIKLNYQQIFDLLLDKEIKGFYTNGNFFKDVHYKNGKKNYGTYSYIDHENKVETGNYEIDSNEICYLSYGKLNNYNNWDCVEIYKSNLNEDVFYWVGKSGNIYAKSKASSEKFNKKSVKFKEINKIFIKYLNINNVEQGPFEFELNILDESIKLTKNKKYNPPSEWVKYNVLDFESKKWFEYEENLKLSHGIVLIEWDISNLKKFGCGISKIFYSVNVSSSSRENPLFDYIEPLEQCYFENPEVVNHKYLSLEAGGGGMPFIDSVSIKVEFRDGTFSEIYHFPNPALKNN